jgi:hypothetical protein
MLEGEVSTFLSEFLSHAPSTIRAMSFKIHTPPNLTDEQMVERVQQYQVEEETGQLRHFDNADQFKEFVESLNEKA